MKKDIFTTIEISDSCIKLLQIKMQKGIPHVSSCSINSLSDNTEDNQVRILNEMLAKDGVSKDALFVMPRKHIVLKQLLLPSHEDEEMRRMVNLQIPSQIPYAREEVILDFVVIAKENSGYTRVLAAFVHRDVVSRFLMIFHRADVVVQKIIISSFGIMNWVFLKREKYFKDAGEVVAFINIDDRASEICFCLKDNFLYSRSISFGMQDLKAGGTKDFVDQIGLTFGVYKKESMGADISKIIIASDADVAYSLKEELAKYYDIPVDIVKTKSDISFDKNFDGVKLKNIEDFSIIENVGAVLSGHKKQINLMPSEVLNVKRMKTRKREIFKFVLSVFLALASGIGVLNLDLYRDKVYLRKIKDRLSETKIAVKKAEKKMEFVEFVKQKIKGNVFIADIIKELYKFIPEEISFRSLNISQKGMISIQGFADTSSSVDEFQRGLVGSKLFVDVNLQYATKRKRYSREYTDFKIVCRIGRTAP